MKNFIAVGHALTFTTPTDLESGAGLLVGDLFGVVAGDAASGEEAVINVTGIYDLAKEPSQAWAVGEKVYWNDASGVCTSDEGGGPLIGVAAQEVAGGAGDIIGRVRLNGVAV